MTFDNATAHADLEFIAETGSAKTNIAELEAVYKRTTATMSTEALRLSVAQEKVNRAIGRSGPESTAAKQATLAYRREQASLASEQRRVASSANSGATAIRRETREIGQLTRGAAIGSGIMRGFSRAAVFAGGGLLGAYSAVRLIKQSISDATSLHEQLHKTNVAFETSSGIVRKWSLTTAEGLGIARDEALKFASSIGALLRPMGVLPKQAAEISTTVVQLGGDLASLYNTDVQTTLTALQAGLSGQVRGLRKYGISLDAARVNELALVQTHKKHTAELTTQDKVLARYTIIMRDSRRAQGDFAKTSDSLANQERILSANLHDTSEVVGTQLYPAVNRLIHRGNAWLEQGKNQHRIQRDVNTAIRDGTQIIHGLTAAEKLVAPPIHTIVRALGGLQHTVELVLILGMVNKAKRAAASFGLIQTASARARTQIVADASVEEKELIAVGVQAERTSVLVSRIGAYGIGGVGGRAGAAKSETGLLRKYGPRVGGPLALAALLAPSYLPGGGGGAGKNLQNAGTAALAGYLIAGPYGAVGGAAAYEITQGAHGLSGWLGRETKGWGAFQMGDSPPLTNAEIKQLAVAVATPGQVSAEEIKKLKTLVDFKVLDPQVYAGLLKIWNDANLYTVTRDPHYKPPKGDVYTVTKPGRAKRDPYALSAAGKRAIDLAEHPNSRTAVTNQLDYDLKALGFLDARFKARKITAADYKTQKLALLADRDQQQSQLDQIDHAAASKQAAADRDYLDGLRAQETTLKSAIRGGHGVTRPDPKTKAGAAAEDALVAFYKREQHDAKLTRSQRARYHKALIDERARLVKEGRDQIAKLRALKEQELKNAIAAAQLIRNPSKERAAEIKADQALVAFYVAREHDANATKAQIAAARSKELAARKAIEKLQGKTPGSTASANIAQFLSSFRQIVGAYAPNVFPVPHRQDGKATTHLYDLVHETRKTNQHLRKIVGRSLFPESHSAQLAAQAAFG